MTQKEGKFLLLVRPLRGFRFRHEAPLFIQSKLQRGLIDSPAQTLWLPSTNHRITPQSFSRRCFSNHAALFALFFLCAVTHQFTWSFQRGLSSCNGILFQNWTLAKTIPVAVQPVPFTSHLLFFFPCFLFTTKTKLRRYPVDETIGGIVEKPQRIVLGRHGR